MKDKLISFILILILTMLIIVIGILGYTVYSEITGYKLIDIKFEGDGGFPTIEINPSIKDATEELLNQDIFSGVEGTEIDSPTTPIESKQYRYLYEQLDDTAKIIYNKFYENKENMKTGTYPIQFGNTFQSLLNQEGGDDELKKQYQSAIEAYIYENPDIFYLDATKMYINIEKITKITGVKYNVYINNGTKPNYLVDGFNSKQDVENYELQIEQVKNSLISTLEGKNDYEKIKTVHDYLIENIEYDTTISQSNIYDVYGALVLKKCVCEGYAKAFQYIMNEIGLENAIVIGMATNSKNQTENHAWNYVKLNEQWYAVDATWDDPVVIGGGPLLKSQKYKYFLKGSNTMNKDHVPSGRFTEEGKLFEYPQLSVEDYK